MIPFGKGHPFNHNDSSSSDDEENGKKRKVVEMLSSESSSSVSKLIEKNKKRKQNEKEAIIKQKFVKESNSIKEIEQRIEIISKEATPTTTEQVSEMEDEWEESHAAHDDDEEEPIEESQPALNDEEEEHSGDIEITLENETETQPSSSSSPNHEKVKRVVNRKSKHEHVVLSSMQYALILVYYNFHYRLNEFIKQNDHVKGLVMSKMQDLEENASIEDCLDWIYKKFKVKMGKTVPNLMLVLDDEDGLVEHIQSGMVTNLFELVVVVVVVLVYGGHTVRYVTTIDPPSALEGKRRKKNEEFIGKIWLEVKDTVSERRTDAKNKHSYHEVTFKAKTYKLERKKYDLSQAEKNYKEVVKKSCEYPIFVLSFDYLSNDVEFNYVVRNVTAKHFTCKYPNTLVGKENFFRVMESMTKTIHALNTQDPCNDDDVIILDSDSADTKPTLATNAFIDKDNALIDSIQHQNHMEIPTSIQDFQTHPIYVIEKFITKYDTIYPKDVDPVAVVKKHNVYLRTSIKPLHTKSRWLRDCMRLVRDGEKPYKIVKAAKFKNNAEFTELFGEWQTDPYLVPSVASTKDPIPKNERGVYELWDCHFLPHGCKHISTQNMPLRGLTTVCRKLGMDYARAMVGFEMKQKRSVPKYDGIIVHEDNEQTLRDAYVEYEKKRLERLKKKRLERIYKNWRRLVKGVWAKEYVKEKYGDKKEQQFLTEVVDVEEKEDGSDHEDDSESDMEEEEESSSQVPTPEKNEGKQQTSTRVLASGRVIEFEQL